jgi:O-antigen biosynthesis protein
MVNRKLQMLQKLIIKIYCKIIFIIEYIYTKVLYNNNDPSKIILDNQTSRQIKAYNSLNNEQSSSKFEKIVAIIPFCDQWQTTQNAIQGLLGQEQSQVHLEIFLINNNSKQSETYNGLNKISQHPQVTILDYPYEFNFSKINNFAINKLKKSPPKYIWFLNNDISFINNSSLTKFLDFIRTTTNCGALGSTLLYPDQQTIQHLFLSPGTKIAGAHPLKGFSLDKNHQWFQSPRPVSAVTGACLMLEFDKFINAQMFDEQLPFSCQDLDLCLKLSNQGLTNWSLSNVFLIHHESMSREKTFYKKEIIYFYNKWQQELFNNNFWSQKFSTYSEQPIFKLYPKRYPWKQII